MTFDAAAILRFVALFARNWVLLLSPLILLASACGGGGSNIILDPIPPVPPAAPGTPTYSNACAAYTVASTTRQGERDGQNCFYSSNFVSEDTPLTVDLTIPTIEGVHLFEATLQVGIDTASGVPADGPTLTIEAGNTLAWLNKDDYLLVTRGSKLQAVGTATAPITFTGYEDAITGTAAYDDVQLWGGIVLNGKGITNKCSDAQRANDTCHVESEGKPSHYGGNDNTDSSGSLRYVVIKHSGAEAAAGDELNGLTLNSVGSGTNIEFVQVYSAFDDGVEFFGGAASISNLVALYVNDDSIDYADGWVGFVTNALIIHHRDNGNRCIEADNQGNVFDAVPNTNGTINNMTCITSGSLGAEGGGLGTHGDSEGILLRRGAMSTINNSIVADLYANDPGGVNGNECLELDESETRAHAANGATSVNSSVIACDDVGKDALADGEGIDDWFARGAKNVAIHGSSESTSIDSNIQLLNGFYTAPAFVDAAGESFTIEPVNGATHIGALTRDNDWTAGWTICLRARATESCGPWFL
ncbi:MAG: serine/threonine protein kinase [Gammaproteobacteria bacterium]|nr:serine/threonine protein kinase [Gammaproteobacteria bacterium]